MESEPKRLHPVTFFDRQTVEEGVVDFRPYYEAVPKAALIGPPMAPALCPVGDTAPVDTVDGSAEPGSEPTEAVKRSAAPN